MDADWELGCFCLDRWQPEWYFKASIIFSNTLTTNKSQEYLTTTYNRL